MLKIKKYWVGIVDFCIMIFFFFQMYACINLFIRKIFHNPSIVFMISIAAGFITFIFAKKIYKMVHLHTENIDIKFNGCVDWLERHSFLAYIIIPLVIKLAIICIFPITYDNGSDNKVYMEISRELFQNGFVSGNAGYSLAFPHLFWFGCFLVPANIFGYSDRIFALYLTVISISGNWILYKSIGNGGGNGRIRAAIMLLYVYLPSQMFTCYSFTHEIGYTFLFICAVYALSLVNKVKYWCIPWLFACILICTARLVNPMGIVAVLAIIFTLILVPNENYKDHEGKSLSKKKKRIINVFIKLLILLAVFISVSKGAVIIQNVFTRGDESPSEKSFIWTLLVGGDYESEGRNLSQSEKLDSYILEKYGTNDISEEQHEACTMELALKLWGDLLKSPEKLIIHLYHKFCNVWSGTHYTIEVVMRWCRGSYRIYALYGAMIINNIIWLFIIAMVCVNICFKRKKADDSIAMVLMKTMILGSAVGLLFTEVCNKYNLTMLVPMIIVIAGYLVENSGPAGGVRE